MAQIKGNKAKGRQSTKKRTYYVTQAMRTARNKARRAAKRANKAKYWAQKKAEAEAAINATGPTLSLLE